MDDSPIRHYGDGWQDAWSLTIWQAVLGTSWTNLAMAISFILSRINRSLLFINVALEILVCYLSQH